MVLFDGPLGELVALKRGYDLPAPARRPGSIPVVSSRGIIDSHDVARVRGPGVVTGRTGTLGEVIYVEEDFWPLNTTLYVRDFKGNDPRFVGYLLETIDYRTLSDKAAVPGVSRDELHHLRVSCPPLRRQKELARGLAPFDRKLDLLRRMDAVHARTAHAHFEALPRDRTARVDRLCTAFANGGTPARRRSEYWERGTIPWFRSGDLADGPLVHAERRITRRGLEESSCRLFAPGAVLLALYAAPTVGRLGVLDAPAAANQACCALRARPECGHWFVFHALLSSRARLQGLAVGAVQQNISQQVLRAFEVEVPRAAAARAFHERVAPLHALRAAHAREARGLRALRDALIRDLLLNEGRSSRTGTR